MDRAAAGRADPEAAGPRGTLTDEAGPMKDSSMPRTIEGHLTAIDVSQHQLAYARAHLDATHVDFRQTDGLAFPPDIPPATAVFSAHVFQHFDTTADADNEVRSCLLPFAPAAEL